MREELEAVGQHKVKVIPREEDYTFRCACGAIPKPSDPVLKTRLAAVDAGEKHLEAMRRVRGLMHGRNVTLEAEHAHYVKMASDPDLPYEERSQWELMAKELGHRLGFDAPPSVQEELFKLP